MNPHAGWARLAACSIHLSLVMVFALSQSGCQDSNALDHEADETVGVQAPAARLRVRVEVVRRAQLDSADHITGTVRAFHRATITAETQGRVIQRHVEAGTAVEVGQLLIELDGSRLALEVRRSEASLRAVQTVLSHAKRELARAERLLAQKATSTQKVDDLQDAVERTRDEIMLAEVVRDTAKRNLEDAFVRAPFSGTVDSLMVDVGDFVTPGRAVARLADLSRVRIFGGVTAREAARLEPGMTAEVSFSDLGGASFEATLQSVGRVASAGDGTYDLEFWMDPIGTAMRDGLVAQIALTDADEKPALLAPRAAILRQDGHPEVFVVSRESGRSIARVRRLRTGRSEGDWIEILSGLVVGDQVVWEGHFALDDGSVVVIDGASANGADADSLE